MPTKEKVIPPELELLNFLIGKWNSVGTIQTDNSEPPVKIKGTDIYEWVLGGFHILHKVDVMMGNERTEVIEIIGYDNSDKTYTLRSFDNYGTFTTMLAEIDSNGQMNISGENMRSTLTVSKSGHQMTAVWEKTEDKKKWLPWIEMNFTK